MKRILSIILVALLMATTALVLVACGGIDNAEDFDKAKDTYATADAITLKIDDNNKMMNNLVNKERLLSTVEIAFDAEKGAVFVNLEFSRRNFWESEIGVGAFETYYLLEGTNVIRYERNVRTKVWAEPTVNEFDSKEEAEAYLREKYMKPTDGDGKEFPTFTALTLTEKYSANLFRNKYTWKPNDNRFNYTYTLGFSNGKISKFTYQHKSANSDVDDTRKFSMTVEYSANIVLPNDLPAFGQAD